MEDLMAFLSKIKNRLRGGKIAEKYSALKGPSIAAELDAIRRREPENAWVDVYARYHRALRKRYALMRFAPGQLLDRIFGKFALLSHLIPDLSDDSWDDGFIFA